MLALLKRTAVPFLTFALLAGGFTLAQAQGNRFAAPLPEPKPLTAAQKQQIEAWRREYPYVSLSDRLKYENVHREDPVPKLTSAGESYLSAREGEHAPSGENAGIRAQSLAMLHSDQVERFIANQGLGFRRMIVPSPEYLQGGASPPHYAFDKLPPLSAEETTQTPTPFLHGEKAPPDDADPAMLKLLPTRSEVANYHRASRHWFLGGGDSGHVKSRDQVAGFIPHIFREPPKMSVDSYRLPQFAPPGAEAPQDPGRWKIARLELVSLLKYPEPRVYESKHLPRMDELREAPTRSLTDFESATLPKLQSGEELLTASTTNQIQMLGAIRAGKHCMQCHEVPRGTLLGAFSYRLQRNPPLSAKDGTEIRDGGK